MRHAYRLSDGGNRFFLNLNRKADERPRTWTNTVTRLVSFHPPANFQNVFYYSSSPLLSHYDHLDRRWIPTLPYRGLGVNRRLQNFASNIRPVIVHLPPSANQPPITIAKSATPTPQRWIMHGFTSRFAHTAKDRTRLVVVVFVPIVFKFKQQQSQWGNKRREKIEKKNIFLEVTVP